MRTPWFPEEMRRPPPLPDRHGDTVRRRTALLLMPFYPKNPHGSFGKHVLTPSLALTSLVAATPPEWEVVLHDENLLEELPPAARTPEVVGVTVHVAFARRAYELASIFKERGATVVLGGPHVTACPGEAMMRADAIVIGNGVRAWPTVLGDVAAGRLKRVYEGDYHAPFESEPVPRRDVLPPGVFLTPLSVIATRGCNSRCEFCWLATEGVRIPRQVRPPADVAGEFRRSGAPYGVFVDNNLGADRPYLARLCEELRPLDVIWSAAVTLDVTDDPGLIRKMALAGCTGVFIGFESLDDTNLRISRKLGPRVRDFGRRVEILHDHGIQVNGSFLFGFDRDRPDVFERTVAWVEDRRLECATFHILTPYPGTPLFRRLMGEGRLLHRDWDLYDTAHAVFRPRHMTPEELERGHAWCYRRIFSHGSIWRRRPADLRAVPQYLGMSYLYKRANRLWMFLIRHGLTERAWRPLVAATRRRHLGFRKRLAATPAPLAVPGERASRCRGSPGGRAA